jgi:CheY-like chemotaxis protein
MSQKKRILVVDDEVDFTSQLKYFLEMKGGFEVKEENKGSRALVTARLFKPDLILLDVMLPGADGGEIASQIKQDPELQGIPIVFLTAALLKEEAAQRQGLIGGQPFLPKPSSMDEVIASIQKHLKPKAP